MTFHVCCHFTHYDYYNASLALSATAEFRISNRILERTPLYRKHDHRIT